MLPLALRPLMLRPPRAARVLPLCCVQAALREMLTILTSAPAPLPAGFPRPRGLLAPRASGSPGVGPKGEGVSESGEGRTAGEESADAAESRKAFPLLDAAFMLKLPVAAPLTRLPRPSEQGGGAQRDTPHMEPQSVTRCRL